MEHITRARPGERYWISYIKGRIRQNKNFIGFISGQTGSGKSYASLSIAKQADPNFDIDRCVFTVEELMDLINSGKLKRGSAIVLEEVGVGVNIRQWQSKINKVLNFLMQTFRHRQFILIMNAPFADFVDSAIRKLMHAEFETLSINFEKETCRIKPMCIQYNGRYKKFYYKYLRVIQIGGGTCPLKIWNVEKPDKELLKKYEEKKTAFTTNLNKELTDDLKPKKEPKRQAICSFCNYKWYPRIYPPARCARCQRPMYQDGEAETHFKHPPNTK